MCDIYPTHFIFLDLITQIFGEDYKLRSFSLSKTKFSNMGLAHSVRRVLRIKIAEESMENYE
jgi:hypothetical protein